MPDLAKFEKNCSGAGETCLRQRCRRSFRKSWKRECKNFKAGGPAGGGPRGGVTVRALCKVRLKPRAGAPRVVEREARELVTGREKTCNNFCN